MNRKSRWIELLLFVFAVAAALAAGCGGGSGAYTTSPAAAREALEASLNSWQKGAGKPEQLALNSVPVHPIDYQWLTGIGLDGYEILSEEAATGANAKTFTVKLKLKKPGKETTAKYLVIGQSPIWVYREEDFARTLNMDNNTQPGPSSKKKR
jgi:hypothetical protein